METQKIEYPAVMELMAAIDKLVKEDEKTTLHAFRKYDMPQCSIVVDKDRRLSVHKNADGFERYTERADVKDYILSVAESYLTFPQVAAVVFSGYWDRNGTGTFILDEVFTVEKSGSRSIGYSARALLAVEYIGIQVLPSIETVVFDKSSLEQAIKIINDVTSENPGGVIWRSGTVVFETTKPVSIAEEKQEDKPKKPSKKKAKEE